MRYFYEYKYKNGDKIGGHNLEKIVIKDNKIILTCVDIVPAYYDEEYHCWIQTIDMNEIEYLKIEQMEEMKQMSTKEELFDKRKEYQETYKDVRIEIKEYKRQQKEFIEWLEDKLNDINHEFAKKDKDKDEDVGYYLAVRYSSFKEILSKYKETIGVKDEQRDKI